MQFLNKLFKSREVAESLEGTSDHNDDEDVDNPPQAALPHKDTVCEKPKPRENKRRRRPDEIELKMIKALEEPTTTSPHISFFQGLMPHLNKFDDSEILEFQMGVLELISKINNKRKNTAQPLPHASQTHSYYPNNYPFPQYQPCPSSQMPYSNQFSPINSFQTIQPQTHQTPNPQAQQFKTPQHSNNLNSNQHQACSSKGQPIEHQQEPTAAQYYHDFRHTSSAPSPSPDTYPSASPSPAGSVYSDTTYDFS